MKSGQVKLDIQESGLGHKEIERMVYVCRGLT